VILRYRYSSSKKPKTKARGKELEHWFEDRLKELGVFYVRPETEKTRKQPCDFIVSTVGATWYIDTKETWQDKIFYNKFPEHQQQCVFNMNHNKKTDRAGFLVWFKKKDPYKMNLRLIMGHEDVINCDAGLCWDFDMLYE
jgi:hypothetical protein